MLGDRGCYLAQFVWLLFIGTESIDTTTANLLYGFEAVKEEKA